MDTLALSTRFACDFSTSRTNTFGGVGAELTRPPPALRRFADDRLKYLGKVRLVIEAAHQRYLAQRQRVAQQNDLRRLYSGLGDVFHRRHPARHAKRSAEMALAEPRRRRKIANAELFAEPFAHQGAHRLQLPAGKTAAMLPGGPAIEQSAIGLVAVRRFEGEPGAADQRVRFGKIIGTTRRCSHERTAI